MAFRGFTIPDGAFLPPELIYLLPNISEARLKVLIAVIYHNTQIGGGEPLSLTDIERITGLSRQSVVTATKELVSDGMLERTSIGNSYAYLPVVKFQQVVQNLDYPPGKMVKNLDHSGDVVKLRESESNLKDSLPDSLNSGGNGQNSVHLSKVQKLRAAGVYLKTAQDLANRYSEEMIDTHIGYYQVALRKNLAQGPGWLVQSLKENWPAPLGSEPAGEEDRSKYAGGAYADYVNS